MRCLSPTAALPAAHNATGPQLNTRKCLLAAYTREEVDPHSKEIVLEISVGIAHATVEMQRTHRHDCVMLFPPELSWSHIGDTGLS